MGQCSMKPIRGKLYWADNPSYPVLYNKERFPAPTFKTIISKFFIYKLELAYVSFHFAQKITVYCHFDVNHCNPGLHRLRGTREASFGTTA